MKVACVFQVIIYITMTPYHLTSCLETTRPCNNNYNNRELYDFYYTIDNVI